MLLLMAVGLLGCPARPPAPPKSATDRAEAAVTDGDPGDGLRFAEQLVDGLLARADALPAATSATTAPASKAEAEAAQPPQAAQPDGSEAPKTESSSPDPRSGTAACDELCGRGTACVAKLIDANEDRLRRPSEAKKRLPESERMCRDDCDDRMGRAQDQASIVDHATKCVKTPDCEAFMRCVEAFFEDG
jgi:hypothetical protein